MAGKVSAPGHGAGKRGRLDVNSDPNVIPFIDVMLVLLIIFMIAAPIATVDVTVDMPDSRIAPTKRPGKPTWVSITDDKNGNVGVYVMNDQVALADLGRLTYIAVNANTPDAKGDRQALLETPIYIRAEGGTKYRNVLQVMNTLNYEGFTKVSLVAEDRRR
ncbi:MAG: hypothetical protein GC206_00365 [Alphaproteobacteria bacterium]|nr:hypothetical protein [Alphaproteobacteria bacterium]